MDGWVDGWVGVIGLGGGVGAPGRVQPEAGPRVGLCERGLRPRGCLGEAMEEIEMHLGAAVGINETGISWGM